MRNFIISMLLIFSMFPQIVVFAENNTVDVWVNADITYQYTSDDEARVIAALMNVQTQDKANQEYTIRPNYNIYNLNDISNNLYLVQMSYYYNDDKINRKNWYLIYALTDNYITEFEIIDKIETLSPGKNSKEFRKNTGVYYNISDTGINISQYPIIVYDRKSKIKNDIIYGTASTDAVYGITVSGFVQQTFKETDNYYTGCGSEVAVMTDLSAVNKFNYMSNGDYVTVYRNELGLYRSGVLTETHTIQISDYIQYNNVNNADAAVRVINDGLIEVFDLYNAATSGGYNNFNISPYRWGYFVKVACVDVSRPLGAKNIPIVDGADTVPYNSSLNFNDTDIPLAYNIKDGVIGENHFNEEVTENINNAVIAANNIVIPTITFVKQSGKKTVTYDIGQDFDKKMTQTDNSMGSKITVEMSKDGKFSYTCTSPQDLTAGSYNKEYQFDKKTVYVRVEIVEQPKTSGSVTVNF